MHYNCKTLDETTRAGEAIFRQFGLPSCVYLEGQLGAGKTTLCQAVIRAAGYDGVVTSPTYNLIHEYPTNKGVVYHMDFYRLEGASEAHYLGLEDLWQENSLFLVEWPSKAKGFLRAADWIVKIDIEGDSRTINLSNVGL